MPPLFQLSVNAMLGSCSRPYNRNSFIKTSYVLTFQPLFAATRCFHFSRRPSAWGRSASHTYHLYPEGQTAEQYWSEYWGIRPEPEPIDPFWEIRKQHERRKGRRTIFNYSVTFFGGLLTGIVIGILCFLL